MQTDSRQRFFVANSPVRGDVVQLNTSLTTVLNQKPYPTGLQCLLGEMLVAASLLISTLKINGRLSVQLQGDGNKNWAMAECNHLGQVRGLAKWDDSTADWHTLTTADASFAAFGKGVLFINIEPDTSNPYQGIVEKIQPNLAACLQHYQDQSMQIPTLLQLACNGEQAGGILLQHLPNANNNNNDATHDNTDDTQKTDADLWQRLRLLTQTITADELCQLPATDILYRLYNEETVTLAKPTALSFACTCSAHKCEQALQQLGPTDVKQLLTENHGNIAIDCGFCGQVYHFDEAATVKLFH